jgi:hypothetical protein
MIKIKEVEKGDNYYTVTFVDGMDAYGVIVTLVPQRPVYIEFMEFAKNKQDLLIITEEENKEEFDRLKGKYFDQIMKHIHDQAN